MPVMQNREIKAADIGILLLCVKSSNIRVIYIFLLSKLILFMSINIDFLISIYERCIKLKNNGEK